MSGSTEKVPAKKTTQKHSKLQKRVIINVFNTEYPLIEKMAIEKMNWRISKKEDWGNTQLDLVWFDLGIDSSTLAALAGYQKVNHFPAMF